MRSLEGPRTQDVDDLTLGAPRSAKDAIHAGAISIEKLRDLCILRDGRSLVDVVVALLCCTAVPLIYATWPYPLVFLACLLLVIRNANYLAQIVHESDHGGLFRNPALNLRVGNLAALMLGYTRSGHRHAHIDHHLYLNTERDPDRIFGTPNQTGREILLYLIQDLFFVTAVKRLLQYSPSDSGPSSISPWKSVGVPFFLLNTANRMLPVVGVQSAIVLLFTATTGPWFYLWLHLVPLMTLYPVQIRIRSAAEHGSESGAPRAGGGTWISRSGRLNVIERLIIAPMDQHYHYEHHVFPGIPNYNLPRAHRELVAAGISIPTHRSYIGFVARKVLRDDRRGSRGHSLER